MGAGDMSAAGVAVVTFTAVGLGELHVSKDLGDELVCFGLGSCVAIAAFDPLVRVGGMAHLVLPDSTEGRLVNDEARFVDTGIPRLIERLEAAGASRRRLNIKISGGAHVLAVAQGFEKRWNMGERNVEAARAVLSGLRLPIVAEDVGGARGRTVRLTLGTGVVSVSMIGAETFEL